MQKYIARRLLLLVVTILGAALLVFAIMRVIPGDIALIMVLGHEDAVAGERAEQRIEDIREEMGLNDPIPIQFGQFLGDFFTLEWGQSAWTGQEVTALVQRRYMVTLQLAVMAMIFTVVMAIPIGIISALRQDSWLDYLLRLFSIIGLSIPNFWLGILALLLLAAYLEVWFPPLTFSHFWDDPQANLSQLLIPSMILGISNAALTARMTRSSMLEVLRQDYIRTAHAKGLASRVVYIRHALRNAMIPVITLAGIQFGNLMSGSVVTEVVFNLPGLGKATVDAVITRDFPVVQTLVLLFTLAYGVLNLSVDLMYAWLNPRIRYQ